MAKHISDLQTEVYALDYGYKPWNEVKDDYKAVHEKLTECERQLGLIRGNYFGY